MSPSRLLSLIILVVPLKSQYIYEECYDAVNIKVDKRGDIYSPGYTKGENYPLLHKCSYVLTTDPNKRIRLSFEDFELERTESCDGDSMTIHAGHDEDAPVLKILCGNERPRDILSPRNALYITFYSDFLIAKRGYHLVFSPTTDRTLCPGQFTCRNRKCISSSLICNKVDDCEDGSDEGRCENSLVTPLTCGQPAIQPRMDDDERIVGGYEVIPGSWPWQSELQVDYIEPNGHVCGGSLINNQWVLTAAHCFEGNASPRMWRVHLGKHQKFQRDNSEQVRYVERIVFHPEITEEEAEYFEFHIDNDIALMKLQTPIQFTDKVKTVCLPSRSTFVAPGTECYATGWGETRGSGANDALKQTKLIIQKGSVCNANPLLGKVNESLIVCAGITDGHHGPCHGDSGGPLVCKLNNRWTIVGIASTVQDTNYVSALCAARNVPTVYTKLSNWVDWIDRTIRKYS